MLTSTSKPADRPSVIVTAYTESLAAELYRLTSNPFGPRYVLLSMRDGTAMQLLKVDRQTGQTWPLEMN